MRKINCRNLTGFTLIEMLVVISIIGMLSALTMVNYKERENKSRTEAQAQKFASILKQAQSMALAGETVEGVRPTGFGIYIINSTSYVLFADMNGNMVRDLPTDNDIQIYTLTNNVTMSSLLTNIVFNLPTGKGNITGRTVSFLFNSVCKQVVLIDSANGQIDLIACP